MVMEVIRAKQIAKSGKIVPVTYEGQQVMIQHVDEEREMARIYKKNRPEEEMEVPVRLLQEQ
ncbi:H-type small acid-soluble spore protein [Parageobacillus toebii]|uniref:H-type small acid-soluble spore protein n=3 Tax=Anoxybacillaceae TaxID=3120669 RepID=A0A226QKU1_9BACL|nr:H-type small acid-soluble spore protein [Geobacillus sp. 44C]OXB92019.1 H-type small acid-soluble spore protein [Parageobacillus galactosidasius]PDM40881.1 H-type small acid-soluble spore protein [Parageobacillus yumthangensis]PUF89457.1 H-type small acid-soluble spore protein [Geobacillus sp. LYN3]RDV22397.1 H-type small acid-soluble spore protein [Parageobacillus toebii]TXK86453.1 H-type small acid-soluble spore protein [Geobacillus sp. AYS3]TXK89818.1 H-type small acid-soluble spore pro